MATLNFAILDAAYLDGLINGSLSERQKIYLAPSVATANKFLSIIRARGDLDIDQIAAATMLDRNTCLLYCRWLASKKLIRIFPNEIPSERDGRQIKNLYVAY